MRYYHHCEFSLNSCIQDLLTSVSVENWTAWEENEAAQLITLLGLDHSGERMETNVLIITKLEKSSHNKTTTMQLVQ